MLTHFPRPLSVAAPYKTAGGVKDDPLAQGELDEVSAQKAEAQYLKFYQIHAIPGLEAHGAASFN